MFLFEIYRFMTNLNKIRLKYVASWEVISKNGTMQPTLYYMCFYVKYKHHVTNQIKIGCSMWLSLWQEVISGVTLDCGLYKNKENMWPTLTAGVYM